MIRQKAVSEQPFGGFGSGVPRVGRRRGWGARQAPFLRDAARRAWPSELSAAASVCFVLAVAAAGVMVVGVLGPWSGASGARTVAAVCGAAGMVGLALYVSSRRMSFGVVAVLGGVGAALAAVVAPGESHDAAWGLIAAVAGSFGFLVFSLLAVVASRPVRTVVVTRGRNGRDWRDLRRGGPFISAGAGALLILGFAVVGIVLTSGQQQAGAGSGHATVAAAPVATFHPAHPGPTAGHGASGAAVAPVPLSAFAVHRVLQHYVAAYRARDAARLLALLAPTFRFDNGNGSGVGAARAVSMWRAQFAQGAHYHLSAVHVLVGHETATVGARFSRSTDAGTTSGRLLLRVVGGSGPGGASPQISQMTVENTGFVPAAATTTATAGSAASSPATASQPAVVAPPAATNAAPVQSAPPAASAPSSPSPQSHGGNSGGGSFASSG
jgi:hypothetical protein